MPCWRNYVCGMTWRCSQPIMTFTTWHQWFRYPCGFPTLTSQDQTLKRLEYRCRSISCKDLGQCAIKLSAGRSPEPPICIAARTFWDRSRPIDSGRDRRDRIQMSRWWLLLLAFSLQFIGSGRALEALLVFGFRLNNSGFTDSPIESGTSHKRILQ